MVKKKQIYRSVGLITSNLVFHILIHTFWWSVNLFLWILLVNRPEFESPNGFFSMIGVVFSLVFLILCTLFNVLNFFFSDDLSIPKIRVKK